MKFTNVVYRREDFELKGKRKKQLWRRMICVMISLMLFFTMLPSFGLKAAEAEDEIMETIPSSMTNAAMKNYFTYTAYEGKSWTNNPSESYIDLGGSDERAEECFYEIHFEGNAISVFATKAPAHGKVKFILDDGDESVADLYNGSRMTGQKVYSVSQLEEGNHVLRAVTMNEKSGSKIVNQVEYAEVTHRPYSGGVPALGGTIGDVNRQYTQSSYTEIASGHKNSAELSAWKNDKAISELVLYSKDCSLSNVRVTASDLTDGENTIPAEHVKTTFIKSVKAYNGGYLGYGDKNRPVPEATGANRSESSDILYQQGGFAEIGWNGVQPVWVEFDIPKDVAAGVYTGTLTASADGVEEPLTFTYTVKVADVVLPDADTYADTFDIELWQYPYSSAEYYDVEPFSEEHLALMESSMLKYKEIGGHAITTTIVEEAWNGQTYSANDVHYPSMIKWTKNDDGSFSYDYTDFDRWVSFCKGLGIGDKIVLYSIAPWHNSFTYWENDTLQYEAFTAGSERYNAVWTDFLEDLIVHLEEKGWFEESYMGIDERGFSAAAFDVIESVTNEDGESLKTAGAMDAFATKKDLAMRVDDLNIGDNAVAAHVAEFQNLLKEREEAGLRTTLYSCTEHKPGNFSLSAPSESYWSIINAAKMGTAGFLRWAYDAWVEDPLRDTTHNAFEPGDCFLIYPDEKDAVTPESKSSVRLERMAEGVRDVNKLLYIEKQEPGYADEIKALYDGIKTTASTGRTYLSENEKNSLSEEMTRFKEGVAAITESYIHYTSSDKEGVYLLVDKKEMKAGSKFQIPLRVVTEQEDLTVVYKSKDPMTASVDASGVITARRSGSTEIMVRCGRFTAFLQVTVTLAEKELSIKNMLTDHRLPEEYLSDVYKGDPDYTKENNDNYVGQPDMIMLNDNKTLYTVFPVGHGKGRLIMMVSEDAGETWTQKTDIPTSWKTSYETPTIYKLNMTNGDTKLIVISGRPASFGAPTGGWDTSLSTDDGETWTEFQTHCETFEDGSRVNSVVAMASLIQLKDEDGNYIDKWMGVFHKEEPFTNYKTYLTFDEEGNDHWTVPVPYLSEYTSIERTYQICEVGMFRSPDGKRIVALARSQSHNNPATMFYSDDEGETWSKPADLPGSLAGERHKGMYDPTDPTGQRLIVTFREIQYDLDNNGQFGGWGDWKAGDWIAWVGTYDDLMNRNEGAYRILLCEDWANNVKSGDTGYSGLVVQPDGTFIIDTYGHWDKEYSQSQSDVYNDWCWIKQAKFKLSVFDEQTVSGIREEIKAEVEQADVMIEEMDESLYTPASWEKLTQALEAARDASKAGTTQKECQEALYRLKEALASLTAKGAESDAVPVAEITLNMAEYTFEHAGETIDLTASVAPERATDQTLLWKTSDPKVAEVSEEGVVTAKGAGTAEITAEASDGFGAKAKVMITVNGSNEPPGEPGGKPEPPGPSGTNPPTGTNPPADSNPVSQLQDGQVETLGKFQYKVIDAAAKTVAFAGGTDKKAKTVKIPDKVDLSGSISCTVVEIGSKAFAGYKSLTSVTIGANVKTIGKNAFSGCKKLKKVTLKGKALKQVKTGAFKKTSAKMVVTAKKLNKKQKKSILSKMKKAGMSKKAKIK